MNLYRFDSHTKKKKRNKKRRTLLIFDILFVERDLSSTSSQEVERHFLVVVSLFFLQRARKIKKSKHIFSSDQPTNKMIN